MVTVSAHFWITLQRILLLGHQKCHWSTSMVLSLTDPWPPAAGDVQEGQDDLTHAPLCTKVKRSDGKLIPPRWASNYSKTDQLTRKRQELLSLNIKSGRGSDTFSFPGLWVCEMPCLLLHPVRVTHSTAWPNKIKNSSKIRWPSQLTDQLPKNKIGSFIYLFMKIIKTIANIILLQYNICIYLPVIFPKEKIKRGGAIKTGAGATSRASASIC